MARFRRENGRKAPKLNFIDLQFRQDIAEEFKGIALEYDMTYSDLLKALMDGNKVNGKSIAPFIKNLSTLLEDFEKGTGIFGSIKT